MAYTTGATMIPNTDCGNLRIGVLSLHYTFACNRNCPGCYMMAKKERGLEEKPRSFFLGFPAIAAKLGIPQIALGGGEPTLDLPFLKEFGKECKENGVVFNLTTNGAVFDERTVKALKDATLVSFSLDANKHPDGKSVSALFEKMDLAKQSGLKVGCNLLMDDTFIEDIYGTLAEVKKHAEYVYLLHPKPNTLKTGRETLKTRLMAASVIFRNVFADNCTLLELGMVKSCERGKKIASIDPYGRASYCSFDRPARQLEKPGELEAFLKGNYPLGDTAKCPFL